VRFHRLERLTSKNATWRGQSATEGQLAQLSRLGIRVDKGATRGQASDLIAGAQANRHLARATPAQIWRLRKSGVPTPEGLTKREASALIDELVRQST
jgi:hypothetical protein